MNNRNHPGWQAGGKETPPNVEGTRPDERIQPRDVQRRRADPGLGPHRPHGPPLPVRPNPPRGGFAAPRPGRPPPSDLPRRRGSSPGAPLLHRAAGVCRYVKYGAQEGRPRRFEGTWAPAGPSGRAHRTPRTRQGEADRGAGSVEAPQRASGEGARGGAARRTPASGSLRQGPAAGTRRASGATTRRTRRRPRRPVRTAAARSR